MPTRAIVPLFLLVFVVLCVSLVFTKPYPSAFDELEHVSYAAHLQETGRIIPVFEEQRTLVETDMARWQDRVNYLGHPSPYYLYVGLFLDRTQAVGRAIIAPRLASAALVLGGVVLVLLTGARAFAGDRLALAVFCLLIAACPKLHAMAGQVTNDALAWLAGGLAYWGASRLGPAASPPRRRAGALAAIGLALLLALWAKPNAGLAVGVFLGAIALLQGRGLPLVAATLGAAALIGLVPYGFIVTRYHALVPLTVEELGGVHQLGSLAAYLPAFLVTLAYTWCFDETGTWPMPGPLAWGAAGLVWLLLALTLAGGWLAVRQRAWSPLERVAFAGPVAALVVLPIHFWFSATRLGYSLPAASFRYYLPLWPGMAHAAAFLVLRAPRPWLRWGAAGVAAAAVGVGWASP